MTQFLVVMGLPAMNGFVGEFTIWQGPYRELEMGALTTRAMPGRAFWTQLRDYFVWL